MDVKCSACDSKDSEIQFLRNMVKELVIPKQQTAQQTYAPYMVNDMGEMIKLDVETMGKIPTTIDEVMKMEEDEIYAAEKRSIEESSKQEY